MFYRVTEYHFPPEREGDIAAWADTKTETVRGIDGLIAVDAFTAAPGQGVIVAAYENEDAFQAGSSTVSNVLGDLAQFLSGTPETKSGVPFWTSRVKSVTAQ